MRTKIKTERKLRRFFASREAKMATLDEMLEVGIGFHDIDDAVIRGTLREGVMGYWLPEATDPGALMVMRRALESAQESENDHE